MNDLTNLFEEFNKNISLDENYKKKVRTARDAVRKKINNYFDEKDYLKPEHYTQGSYPMHTAIVPLEGEDFDLDNGVYLQGFEASEDWPKVSTVHNLIKNAVMGHTEKTIDKNVCVRVVYKDNYHIDLPIYILGNDENGDEVAFLAHKTKGWIISDPKAFREWFNQAVKENDERQLRRIVKYLKQWAHFKNIDISGMAITILATKNYDSELENSDAEALLEVLVSIIDSLTIDFSCFKPVRPKDEDLFSEKTYNDQQKLLSDLIKFKDKLNEAIFDSKNQFDSSTLLREIFGKDRFPEGDINKKNNADNFIKTNEPENLGKTNKHYA